MASREQGKVSAQELKRAAKSKHSNPEQKAKENRSPVREPSLSPLKGSPLLG